MNGRIRGWAGTDAKIFVEFGASWPEFVATRRGFFTPELVLLRILEPGFSDSFFLKT
jgi:hypothetical protein